MSFSFLAVLLLAAGSIALDAQIFAQGAYLILFFNVFLLCAFAGGNILILRFGRAPIIYKRTAVVLAAVLLYLHTVGDIDGILGFDFYGRYAQYDTSLHFLGGLTVSFGVIATFWPARAIEKLLLGATSAFSIGIAWEFFELSVDAAAHLGLYGNIQDTLTDLAADTLGGIFAACAILFFVAENPGRKAGDESAKNTLSEVEGG